jgi:hypothetical protein
MPPILPHPPQSIALLVAFSVSALANVRAIASENPQHPPHALQASQRQLRSNLKIRRLSTRPVARYGHSLHGYAARHTSSPTVSLTAPACVLCQKGLHHLVIHVSACNREVVLCPKGTPGGPLTQVAAGQGSRWLGMFGRALQTYTRTLQGAPQRIQALVLQAGKRAETAIPEAPQARSMPTTFDVLMM